MSGWSQAVSAHPMAGPAEVETFAGNRGLQIEEGLIFEQGLPGRCGVDFADPAPFAARLGGLERRGEIGLPGLSEPQVIRHFTRLSQKNYAIDSGLYPLGSCTMKHNPRLNERLARLPGFADIHPLQPMSTVPGALALIDSLAHWLKTLTGMPTIALSPGAGAHGELCGMMTIRAALEARGERRSRVLVPESAHGTNPATAAACGYAIDPVPHGGGGPGSGPVALAASLARFAPLPWIVHGKDGLELAEHKTDAAEQTIGRLKGFHGQMGMFVRALAYMMSHGADGLRQVAEDAVLNANYLRARLDGELSLSFPGPCMHEVLFDDRFLRDTGVTTFDFAKALIDEGYHPMTMYFPLVVHGALLIEPAFMQRPS